MEHRQNYPYLLQKYEKNSNFAVFGFANNFIPGIQFLAHRLAVKKLATMQVPRDTPKTTLICSKNKRKTSSFAVYEIANNFIPGIPFLARRLARKKLVTLKVPRSTPKTDFICSKNTIKILISPFLRSPIILFPEYNFWYTD